MITSPTLAPSLTDTKSELGCALCAASLSGIEPVLQTELGQIVRVTDTPDYPAFYRFIWHQHVAEFSDLTPDARHKAMNVVYCIERALRDIIAPDKINLASLGNKVPHLHWHVVARFAGDAHFPDSIWSATSQSNPETEKRNHFQSVILPSIAARLPQVDDRIKSLVHSL